MKCKNCGYDFDEYNDIFCPGCGIRIAPADKIKPKKPLYGKKVCIWALLLSWFFPVGLICGFIGLAQTRKNDLKEYRKLAITAIIISTIVMVVCVTLCIMYCDKIPVICEIAKLIKKK